MNDREQVDPGRVEPDAEALRSEEGSAPCEVCGYIPQAPYGCACDAPGADKDERWAW